MAKCSFQPLGLLVELLDYIALQPTYTGLFCHSWQITVVDLWKLMYCHERRN